MLGLNNIIISPIPVMFILIERCMALKLDLIIFNKYKNVLTHVSCIFIFFSIIIGIFCSILELPLLNYEKSKF